MEQPQHREGREDEAEFLENAEKVYDSRGTKDHVLIMVVALLVVALTAAYLWGSSVGSRGEIEVQPDTLPPMLPQDEVGEAFFEQSTSDEIEAIERDLLKTDLETLDTELELLEAELGALLRD